MIDENSFNEAFDEVVNNNDKIIVLYSGIWTFINNLNFNIKDNSQLPKTLLEIIEKKIGKNKTLFLPSFTGKIFSNKKIINFKRNIDKENGVLSLSALKKNYYRTKQPIHSYLVYGDTSKIKKTKILSSWGENSLLEFFSKNNARICTLGLPWNKGCAYLHRFEEIFNVPWRYKKKISSKVKINKKNLSKYSEIKFCSSNKYKLIYDYKPFVKYIEQAKSFKKSTNNLIKFESIKASCLDKIGFNIFSQNPWIIIKNIRETKNWIKNFKDLEILESLN